MILAFVEALTVTSFGGEVLGASGCEVLQSYLERQASQNERLRYPKVGPK